MFTTAARIWCAKRVCCRFSAKFRAALRWPEGDCSFLAALRAAGFCFCAWSRIPSTAAFRPLCLATLAALRLVFESLVGEKHLFAGGKNKLSAALRTLQYLVVEFHDPAPPGPISGGGRALARRA